MASADIIIIGAGMAGASLAAAIGTRAGVLLLEAESLPGYHATGRSAAFWEETYGGPAIQPLTTASGPALAPFLSPRGALHIARDDGLAALATLAAEFAGRPPALERIDAAELHRRLPGLDPAYVAALASPGCQDIDVAGLHADYLKQSSRLGVSLANDSNVIGLRREPGRWVVETVHATFTAPIVVNAAGAWASAVAGLAGAAPIVITPCRRTVVQLVTDPAMAPDMPLVLDARGHFYFKPEVGGRIWLSPQDETPSPAQDVAPEELDVATAIDRFERTVDWRIVRRERAWAGLRSFAPDRAPVYGWDGRAEGFFWFAGQGGFGIQTAPAAAALAAALLLDQPFPEMVRGIDAALYSPRRFS